MAQVRASAALQARSHLRAGTVPGRRSRLLSSDSSDSNDLTDSCLHQRSCCCMTRAVVLATGAGASHRSLEAGTRIPLSFHIISQMFCCVFSAEMKTKSESIFIFNR